MQVCHRCDNPACVNCDHLFLGTNEENTADRVSKGRSAAGDRSGPALRPERMPRGEAHGRAKLTNAAVIEIRRRYAAGGTSQPKLAREFGVDHTVIGDIVRREKWKHVPDPDMSPHYQARQRGPSDFGFTTPTGESFGFVTRFDALKAAANTERDDRIEAADPNRTGPISKVLRSHFFPNGLPQTWPLPLDLRPHHGG